MVIPPPSDWRENVMDLKQLTGQESGIIVYGNNYITVANWNGLDGLPVIYPTGLIGNMPSIPVESLKVSQVNDVASLLPESYEILHDPNGDLDRLSGPGTAYTIRDEIMIIAPEGWN